MKNTLAGLLMSFYSTLALAEESAPVVGRHVEANLDVASILLSLLLVLALIIAVAFLAKRIQPQGNKLSGMKVVTSLHLGTKERLVVVEVDDKQLLLGVTAQQISLIQTLENKMEVGQPLTMDIGQNIVKLLKKNDK